MPTQHFLDDDFVAQLRYRLQMALEESDRLANEAKKIDAEREKLAKQIGGFRNLLGDDEAQTPDGTTLQQPSKGRRSGFVPMPRPPLGRKADADDVYELLKANGPMHYEEIFSEILKRGLKVGGQGKPNTLLSRYFNDDRLERVKRGTYAVRETVEKGRVQVPPDTARGQANAAELSNEN